MPLTVSRFALFPLSENIIPKSFYLHFFFHSDNFSDNQILLTWQHTWGIVTRWWLLSIGVDWRNCHVRSSFTYKIYRLSLYLVSLPYCVINLRLSVSCHKYKAGWRMYRGVSDGNGGQQRGLQIVGCTRYWLLFGSTCSFICKYDCRPYASMDATEFMAFWIEICYLIFMIFLVLMVDAGNAIEKSLGVKFNRITGNQHDEI